MNGTPRIQQVLDCWHLHSLSANGLSWFLSSIRLYRWTRSTHWHSIDAHLRDMFWISYASYIVRTSGTNYIYKQYLVTINLQENHIFVQINWLFSQFGRNIKPQKSEREIRVKQRERLLFCVNAYLKKSIFLAQIKILAILSIKCATVQLYLWMYDF